MKLQRIEIAGKAGQPGHVRWLFYCPGCKTCHTFSTDGPGRPNWSFNGSVEAPTFSPSLLVYTTRPKGGDASQPEDERVTLCHLFVRGGKIEFCSDSPHALAGRTVDMVDIPEAMRW